MVKNLPVETAVALCLRGMAKNEDDANALISGFNLALALVVAQHQPGFMAEMAPLMRKPNPMDQQAAWAFKTFIQSATAPEAPHE